MQRVTLLRTAAVAGAFLVVGAALVALPIRWVPFLVLVCQALAVALGFLLASYLAALRPLAFVSSLGAQSLNIYLLHLFIVVPAAGLLGLAELHVPRIMGVVIQFALVALAVYGSLLAARWTTRLRWLYVPRPIRRGFLARRMPSSPITGAQ
jgi:fucose 4-O-acetylase-like acetyltransferase